MLFGRVVRTRPPPRVLGSPLAVEIEVAGLPSAFDQMLVVATNPAATRTEVNSDESDTLLLIDDNYSCCQE